MNRGRDPLKRPAGKSDVDDVSAGHHGLDVSAQRRAIETGKQFTAEGKNVRYLRSVFVPGESHCMCLFEAPSPQLVKEVNEVAQIPFTRIVEAMDLTP